MPSISKQKSSRSMRKYLTSNTLSQSWILWCLKAHDFDAGAMENWGLVTGRTSAFFLDSKKAGSHEIAHTWFGDITTMEWWDYLYLNEGQSRAMVF
ncbi:peptidase family M1-domain-containing protein [Suillus lakei]|nr:peptidase family M1-domain-containing protein [Suillus lakei]